MKIETKINLKILNLMNTSKIQILYNQIIKDNNNIKENYSHKIDLVNTSYQMSNKKSFYIGSLIIKFSNINICKKNIENLLLLAKENFGEFVEGINHINIIDNVELKINILINYLIREIKNINNKIIIKWEWIELKEIKKNLKLLF